MIAAPSVMGYNLSASVLARQDDRETVWASSAARNSRIALQNKLLRIFALIQVLDARMVECALQTSTHFWRHLGVTGPGQQPGYKAAPPASPSLLVRHGDTLKALRCKSEQPFQANSAENATQQVRCVHAAAATDVTRSVVSLELVTLPVQL